MPIFSYIDRGNKDTRYLGTWWSSLDQRIGNRYPHNFFHFFFSLSPQAPTQDQTFFPYWHHPLPEEITSTNLVSFPSYTPRTLTQREWILLIGLSMAQRVRCSSSMTREYPPSLSPTASDKTLCPITFKTSWVMVSNTINLFTIQIWISFLIFEGSNCWIPYVIMSHISFHLRNRSWALSLRHIPPCIPSHSEFLRLVV